MSTNLGLAAVWAILACAPTVPRAGDDPASPTALEQVLAHESATERRVVGLIRARASYPQIVSGGLGLMVERQPADYDCTTVCEHRGLLLQIEPGLGGLQLAAGWGLVVGDLQRNRHFLADYYVGFGLKGVVLRTWGEAPLEPADQTFVGVEGDFTVAAANFSLGVLHGVFGEREHKDWLVTAGLGWGF